MIPKLIHYCWFGSAKQDALVKRCKRSWRKHCPEYTIIEWNENNYDISKAPKYVQEAYQNKMWAFVSYYVRFDVLYKLGGIYFDTDVEIIRNIDGLVADGPFLGCEEDGNDTADSITIDVAPGLGIATYSGMSLIKDVLDTYENESFFNNDGTQNLLTVDTRITRILLKHGLKNNKEIQYVDGFKIYPKDFFNPKGGHWQEKMEKTENTVCIHHFAASWYSKEKRASIQKYKEQIKVTKKRQVKIKFVSRIIDTLGEERYKRIRGIFCFSHRRVK